VYRLNLDPVAEEQINAIPEEALRPLAELFTLLETAPWSGQPSTSTWAWRSGWLLLLKSGRRRLDPAPAHRL
jgi:hypothetical protein